MYCWDFCYIKTPVQNICRIGPKIGNWQRCKILIWEDSHPSHSPCKAILWATWGFRWLISHQMSGMRRKMTHEPLFHPYEAWYESWIIVWVTCSTRWVMGHQRSHMWCQMSHYTSWSHLWCQMSQKSSHEPYMWHQMSHGSSEKPHEGPDNSWVIAWTTYVAPEDSWVIRGVKCGVIWVTIHRGIKCGVRWVMTHESSYKPHEAS